MRRRHYRLLLVLATMLAGTALDAGLSNLLNAAPANAPAFAVQDVSCAVTVGNCVVPIYATGGNGRGSWIQVTTSDSTATAPADYVSRSQPIYVSAGHSASIAIPIVNDQLVEPNETFRVTISAKQNAQIARGVGTVTIINPAPPSPPVQCPDGTSVPAGQTCPVTPPPPPPAITWVAGPLQDGGFARIINASDSEWAMTGPGGRALVNGEIVAIYFNGWGYQANNQPTFVVYALSDGATGRALASDLQGLAPAGSPPPLPDTWWVPGPVVAARTCASALDQTKPGVTQGTLYRAAKVAGTHMKLADGVTSVPSIMWEVFGTGAQTYAAAVVVTGDCLTGTSIIP